MSAVTQRSRYRYRVSHRQSVNGGRIARWVLLACTVFGLATMHTFGHAGMHIDGHGPHPTTVDGPPAVAPVAETAQADLCPGCAHVSPVPHPVGGMPAWSICLAVLGGLAVVLLLAALVVCRSRSRVRLAAGTALRWFHPRGPPCHPAGLMIATVSVLRI
jgi:hypothetical protein